MSPTMRLLLLLVAATALAVPTLSFLVPPGRTKELACCHTILKRRQDVAPPYSIHGSPLSTTLPTRKCTSFAIQRAAADSRVLTDLLVAGMLGFAMDPLVEIVFNATTPDSDEVDFNTTFLYHAADSIAVAAHVFGALVVVGVLASTFRFEMPVQLREVTPRVALTIWAALTVSAIKRAIFQRVVAGDRLGRVTLYDRLIDAILAAVTATIIVDQLSIDFGMSLQSILAGGGLGALVFSLASKELATNIVGGFIIQAWDAFNIGDHIRLGDGMEGTVMEIRLVESEICGYDNIAIRIPNSQLFNQRVSNMSRIRRSQVRQVLRFKYSDMNELPNILNDIKDINCSSHLQLYG